ncbi:MAG: hypothetical protein IJB56_02855 [Alistipes sp.]|nr:hypothetical protein [Alistipes sp.]
MANARATYGNGSVYQRRDGYVAQILATVEIEGKEYSKRVSGSGKTAKAAE